MCTVLGKDLRFGIPGWETEFLCVNLLRCFTTVSSGTNKRFYYVFVVAEALVIRQKLVLKKGRR